MQLESFKLSKFAFFCTLVATSSTLLWFFFKKDRKKRKILPPSKSAQNNSKVFNANSNQVTSESGAKSLIQNVRIFYASQTGTGKYFAEKLSAECQRRLVSSETIDLQQYDPEDRLVEEIEAAQVCVFVVSTYTDGLAADNGKWFCQWIKEASSDFRVHKSLLKGMNYSVVALGNSLYSSHFCECGIQLDTNLHNLSATRLLPVVKLDENVSNSVQKNQEEDFNLWMESFWKNLCVCREDQHPPSSLSACGSKSTGCSSCSCGNSAEPGADSIQYESSSDEYSEADEEEDDGGGEKVSKLNGLVDLEDLGKVVEKVETAKKKKLSGSREPREMITPLLRKNLEKQGYRLVGTHSGVKLCRWTKAMMRGRGGCYKHTFYGIESHRCMEATPSLACANKCVFCWRHHTNPVGTEWKWKMDDAQLILDGSLKNHYGLVKQFKGVPGVKPERFAESMRVKHCALSLVGEPIMYPEINSLITLLHKEQVSTFLVTNAQFPLAIRNLVPVTQLYVSIDASTKESLKKIDRPLFKDFWTRFLDSLKALSEKGQRTVYRLTLVKAWNTAEMQSYADLVSIGTPDFIEIKGVTFCGDSKASSLTMENVPWHSEVVQFVTRFVDLLPDYEIASEHEHSNCILIAHKKFKIADRWHTWIDYPKFHELIARYEETQGEQSFTAADYMCETPPWAIYGCAEQGFDPAETRFYRKKRKDIGGC